MNGRRPCGLTLLLFATVVAVIGCGSPSAKPEATQTNDQLLAAAAAGDVRAIRVALEAGADPTITNLRRYCVDPVNRLGWTALLEAILLSDGGPRHQELVALLIDHGADVDLADKDGIRPLAHARTRSQSEIMALLRAAGAS